MGENLIQALVVTAFGMGITFAAIVLLWLLMAAIGSLAARAAARPAAAPPAAEPTAEPATAPAAAKDPMPARRAMAAAAAVAVALGEQAARAATPAPPAAGISPWQLGTRTRQLYEKGRRRR